MKRRSIRTRLALWTAAVSVVVLVVLGEAGAWLVRRSAVDAADRRLAGQIASVKTFVERLEPNLSRTELAEEFGESSDLAPGDVLMQVTDPTGFVFCRPGDPLWPSVVAAVTGGAPSGVRVDGRAYRAASGRVTARGAVYHVVAAVPMGLSFDATQHVGWLVAIVAPFLFFGAGTIAYVVTGRALAPVDRMTRAAQAMTLRGLDRRVDLPPDGDELHRLAATFNDMLARLQDGVREMAQFTADASHELRTPVTLVRTGAELALRRDRTPEEYRRALDEIRRQSEYMTRIIDDLLVLARADAGVEPRETSGCELGDALKDLCDAARPVVAGRGLTLNVDLPREAIALAIDAGEVRRLFAALLDNAVKYTPAGGVVTVRLARIPPDRDRVAVDIVDSGAGLDPAEAPRIFERFFRGDAARRAAPDGSGLGLAVARSIAERHGGTIALTTRADAAGCIAHVTLPVVGDGRRASPDVSSARAPAEVRASAG
jgi:heavy metal sensor kinase